jgi:uncharacterized protein YkwD/uncharacterized membrane protein required for colicin V production
MLNFVDLLIFLLVLVFIWQGYRVGLVGGLLNLLITLASFIIATFAYPAVGDFLIQVFKVNENLARVAGFIVTLTVLELILNTTMTYFYGKVAPLYRRSKIVAKADHVLGVFPSLIVGLFLILLVSLLILTLPVQGWLREPIQESWWGRNIVPRGLGLTPAIEKTLNRLPYKNLVYIITPENPSSEATQDLNIPSDIRLTPDSESEKAMWELVNKERRAEGLKEVKLGNPLRDVGRAHCQDMFERSYFSHYTPEGKSPFDRLDEARIDYVSAGENLAYAPSVALAHQGLMNSPGHKANILRESFGTLGVGVIDGGLYGKMFCQEFTD